MHDVYWFTGTSIKYSATTYMKVQPKIKVPNCRPGLRNNSVLPLESQPSKTPTRVSHHLNSQNTPILFFSLHFFPLYTHRTPLFFPYRIWWPHDHFPPLSLSLRASCPVHIRSLYSWRLQRIHVATPPTRCSAHAIPHTTRASSSLRSLPLTTKHAKSTTTMLPWYRHRQLTTRWRGRRTCL